MKTIKMVKAIVALFAVAFAVPAMAETEEVDGITWTYTVNDGKAEIGGGLEAAIPTTTAGAIDVPSTLGGYPVTRIGENAFASCPLLTRVKIPSGVTSIGNFVFHSATALRDLAIPKTVESLDGNAFLANYIEVIHVEDGDVERVRTLVSGVSSETYTYVVGFPENDDFANAAELLGSSGSVNASNVGATTEANEPLVAAFAGEYTAPGATVWWTWTAPSDCLAFFDTVGSAFDTVLGVYTGDSLQALTTVATNDDNTSLAFPNKSKVSFVAVSGQSYRIAVGGHQYFNTGDVVLNWNTFDIPDYASVLGAPASMTFTPSGDKPWVAGGTVDEKTTLKSGLGTTDDSKSSTLTATFSGPGTLSFWYKVDSEYGYDKLEVFIDGGGNCLGGTYENAGNVPWTKYEWELGVGNHTVVWTYLKDSRFSSGSDCAWIAEVRFGDKHTVTFDGNGGTPDFESMLVTNSFAYGELPEATLEGHKFLGWFTEAEGGEQVTAEMTVDLDADQTLYAHWTRDGIEPGEAVELTFDDIGYKPPEGEGFTYAFKGLPAGLKYDSKSGKIVGKATKPGDYEVTVTAKNKANPKGVVGTVAMKVANFTDGQIPVEDSYGPYIPGVGYVETIDAAAGCKASGLPSGMKWTDKAVTDKTLGAVPAHSVYGAPTKPGKYTVTFTKTVDKVKHTASSTVEVGPLPELKVVISGTGTGKVTGAGAYAAGKKVTLKATADTKDAAATDKKPETKKSVFSGWFKGDELLSRSASYSYTMPEEGATLTAEFITAAQDAEYGASLAIAGVEIEEVQPESETYATNVICGVYLEWPVAVDALSATTVKVAGLPAGLKFTAKDIVDSKTKEVTVPANTIYGTPTKASKWNASTGLYEPTTVKVTVTTAGKTVKNFAIAMAVEELAVAGTFDGGSDEAQAQATFTVAANGKISGKFLCGGTNWTFSASSFAYYDDDVYTAIVTRSSGKESFIEYLIVYEHDGMQGAVLYHLDDLENEDSAVLLAEFIRTDWKSETWKAIGKTFPKNATLTYPDPEEGEDWSVTLKFESSGAVKVSGAFVVGKDAKNRDIVYKASGSATLIPISEPEEGTNAFAARVIVYLAPNAKKNFPGYMAEIPVNWSGKEFYFPTIRN